MAEPVHGTRKAMRSHVNHGEPLCETCFAFDRDRQRSYRIIRGQAKEIRVSTLALARILRGWRPEVALADEIGPQTLEAIRNHRAGEQRG